MSALSASLSRLKRLTCIHLVDLHLLRHFFGTMPLISEMVHPSGFSFQVQRLIALRRVVHKDPWNKIAANKGVRNLKGGQARARHIANTFRLFNVRAGRRQYNYDRCGNKPSKCTKEVETYLVKTLKELRRESVCTSTVLQQRLAKDKGVRLSAPYIRKILERNGYKWMARRQKRKYNKADRQARMAFARKVLAMSGPALREFLSLAMDGVVLSMPPTDPTERMNFCRHGETHMWRKESETFSPELAGEDDYGNQVPLARAVPMWGGCSEGGFSVIAFHPTKKMNQYDWSKMVRKGDLVRAVKAVKPVKGAGPWTVLCDNETFLRTKVCSAAHKAVKVKLWSIPRRSPDCNPVEKFWAWLRSRLRAMDLRDAVAKRAVPSKTAYRARVRRLCQTKKAQKVAGNHARALEGVCRIILQKKSAHSGK